MKILIVGLGSIGQRHVRNIRRLMCDSAEIIAFRVRGKKETLSDAMTVREGVDLEKEYNIRSFYSIEEALLERPDAAVIANPTSEHMKYALLALRSGCHLFLEKPISDSLAFTQELKDLAQDSGRMVFVGYQNRYHPALLKLREWLGEKLIGHILSIRAEIGERVTNWHSYEDYRIMYAVRKDLGGGVVLSQIHELDYLTWLFGMPYDLYAVGGRMSDLEMDVEDVADILFRFRSESGSIPVSVHMDYLQWPPARCCKVIGNKGQILVDLLRPSIRCDFYDGTTREELFESFTRNDMFIEEMKAFLDCVQNGSAPAISLNDGIRSLKLALAVKKSMESGQIIHMPENHCE